VSALGKIRDLFRQKPLTEDELRAREEAKREKDEQRFRKLSQHADPWLPDASREIDRWSE
jgi:hypothetical protein